MENGRPLGWERLDSVGETKLARSFVLTELVKFVVQMLYLDVALVVQRIADSLLLSDLYNECVFMFHYIWQT